MKKFIIGLAVFAVFVIYSLGIRHEVPVIGKPSSLATSPPQNTASPTNTATSNASGSSGSSTSSSGSSSSSSHSYKDGTYTGSVADAFYGSVQVAAVISGGKITDVKVLQYPNTHSTSVAINQQALPYLKQEAIQSQSSNVQVISGATFTSQAYAQSLSNALSQAQS